LCSAATIRSTYSIVKRTTITISQTASAVLHAEGNWWRVDSDIARREAMMRKKTHLSNQRPDPVPDPVSEPPTI